ncbi:MAG TPA: hypothetical protein VN711_04625 [Candidatus Saccharimonadales bacterium]|nr:hypothetical protein [Candidatus Saccharimonadales bacterium]
MTLDKTKEVVRKLPKIKPHLDFLAAILTIPVLLTVIILNFSTLSKNKTASITPTPTNTSIPFSTNSQVKSLTIIPVKATPTPSQQNTNGCSPTIGPISIVSPSENQTVTTNPVCIGISYSASGYCSVVWAYRINGGALSDYSNNSACLYNMPSGPVTFELDVKSLAGNDTTILQRHFVYQGATTPTVSPSPTSTPSVSPTPSPTPVQ